MEQYNHLNDKSSNIYTAEDFQDALARKFPDGMTLSMRPLKAEHFYNYFRMNSFDGDASMVMKIGKDTFDIGPTPLLQAEVRIKPEDYKYIEAGDIMMNAAGYDTPDGVESAGDDYASSYVMNEYPDLDQAPVIVSNSAVARNMWVEGLHFHDALAIVMKNQNLEDNEMKSALQLKAIYTRGVKFFEEGWHMTADVAQKISSPVEWQKEHGGNSTPDVYDSTIKRQAMVSLQWAGFIAVIPKTHMVFIHKDNDAQFQQKLDQLADEFNSNYLEESLVDKAAYAIHPEGADYLLVNINTTNPLRFYAAQNRMERLEGYNKSFKIKYENLYQYLKNIPEPVLDKMNEKVQKVNEKIHRQSQLNFYVNNGGAYFYQHNALGYVHISTDRTMRVNGEPMMRLNMIKLNKLAVDGNIIGHRGTERHTLFCPPLHSQQRLMMDNSSGKVQHMDIQYDMNRKEYLTLGYKVMDPSLYTDITARIGNVAVYGQKDRLFLRAVIDGQQQPGKLLTNAQKNNLDFYVKDFQSEGGRKYLKLMAGQVYQAELEQNTAEKCSRDEEQSKGFKR